MATATTATKKQRGDVGEGGDGAGMVVGPRTLSHAAWWLASSGLCEHPAMGAVIEKLLNLQDRSFSSGSLPAAAAQQSSSSSRVPSSKLPSAASPKTLATAVSRYDKAGLDHRSLCRLAWALSVASASDFGPAWDLILRSATASIENLVQVRKYSTDERPGSSWTALTLPI